MDLDKVGATASLLCAVHCAIIPLVVTFGVLGGGALFASHLWETIFISLSLVIASASLYNGYKRHHKSLKPMSVALSGFALILIGHLWLGLTWGHGLAAIGGTLVAVAHWLNYKACHSCRKCRD